MTDPVFQQAYDIVRAAHSGDAWRALTPRQITTALYLEIRRIDAERAAARLKPGEASRASPGPPRRSR